MKFLHRFPFVIKFISVIAANQSPQISNQVAQVSNQSPQVSNQSPQVSNQSPQISYQMPQVPQHPRPGYFEREQKCSQMFQQGKDCGWSGGCCHMDTWLDQVGLRMRNIINKEDGQGKLKLHNNRDVRAHWDGFFRQTFKRFK